MKMLVSNAISSPRFTTSISRFSSLPRKNPIFLNFPYTKPLPTCKITTLYSYSADYGGWADLISVGESGESNQLSRLLSSLGIDDKKYAFVYLLGFVCALAVSRVRISSIVFLPACFLVFAVGFSFGIVNGGNLNEVMSLFGGSSTKKNKKKRFKSDEFRVSIENLRDLTNLLNGYDVDIMNLKNGMRKHVDSNRITKNDLVHYIEGVESIEQAILQAKSMIEGFVGSMAVDTNDVNYQKGFDISQFIADFPENSFGSRPSRAKDSFKNDNIKNDSRYIEASDHNQANILDEDGTTKSIPSEKEAYNEPQNESRFAASRSSEISDDMLFNEYVTEANALLKRARECLRRRGVEEGVENMLYKSTELLVKAVEMKPMSLLAVGQLGNTYLLHGELKLKVSRKLRALLAQSDPNVLEMVDGEVANREKLVDYLVDVCDECEELLVKAGRQYRLALSIDGDDMRALYNWGLALSFRAQLIADIGPEAALDADKVYMAAIDKFDAMMSKSNTHTPDALFRWGVALQQRSRLRTRNFREKVKLLSQAKRLYEDALLMDSNNLQVKEALSTCVSELRYRNSY